MKTLFDIRGKVSGNAYTLLLEIGPDTCNYAFYNKEGNSIDAMKCFTLSGLEIEERIPELIAELKGGNFNRVIVCSAFPEAVLVPQNQYHQNHFFLSVMFDKPGQIFLDDTIIEWQMVNMYALPGKIYETIMAEFPTAEFFHTYTPFLRNDNNLSDSQIFLHVTTQYLRVIVKKGQQLQLAQIYSYQSAMDATYYLLKICYEFHMNQDEVTLVLSGLITDDSGLYDELKNYFSQIQFVQPPFVAAPEKQQPDHLFSSLYNLTLCAS